MQTETFILEEKNLGDAQQAYEDYPKIEKNFHKKLNEYKNVISEFESRKVLSISLDEMRQTDQLAKNIEEIKRNYDELQSIINKTIDKLIIESKQKANDFEYYANKSKDNIEEINQAKSILEEAQDLKDKNNIIMAIDKAYIASECIDSLLLNSSSKWMNQHKQNLNKLTLDIPF